MFFWIPIAVSLAGTLFSCGIAYGILRAAIKHLREIMDLLRADLKEVRADVQALTHQLADCDKRIALVAVELNLSAPKRLGKN